MLVTSNETLQKIQNDKIREILKLHKTLIDNYLILKNIGNSTRLKLLNYYDTQIDENNIEHYYNQKIPYFLNNLLS